MNEFSNYVGLDVHKETIAVAVARPGTTPAASRGTIANTPVAVAKLVQQLGGGAGLSCCYEAGPCGYALQRQLEQLGAVCIVVAPSLIPRLPGDKVKTDRRDAEKLARLLRSGDLTAVWVPDAEHEALRDLCRAREDAQQELVRVKNRLGKLLLRLSLRPPAGTRAGTQAHTAWLRGLTLPHPVQQVVLEELRSGIAEAEARLKRLEATLAEAKLATPVATRIAGLQVLRGVGLVTAASMVAEIGDVSRFTHPRQLMAYAGVVPSEHSSGGRQQRGRITKCGNSHLRRVLVEAAQHYRHLPHVGSGLRKRQTGQPAAAVAIGWRAQQRLHRRYFRLVQRGKSSQQAIVAIARELLGFIWAVAQTLSEPAASAAHAAGVSVAATPSTA